MTEVLLTGTLSRNPDNQNLSGLAQASKFLDNDWLS